MSITGGVHFDLVKRVMRDISRSGQDAEGIISQVGGGHESIVWCDSQSDQLQRPECRYCGLTEDTALLVACTRA